MYYIENISLNVACVKLKNCQNTSVLMMIITLYIISIMTLYNVLLTYQTDMGFLIRAWSDERLKHTHPTHKPFPSSLICQPLRTNRASGTDPHRPSPLVNVHILALADPRCTRRAWSRFVWWQCLLSLQWFLVFLISRSFCCLLVLFSYKAVISS